MTDSMSTSMDISGEEEVYKTCPTPGSIADKIPLGFTIRKIQDPRDFKRSRFDEIESYKEVGHVGSGGFGNCLLLQKRSNATLRVCKVQKRPKSELEPLEVEILRDVINDHPRIVRLNEAIMHTHTMQLYFDYYPGGDLYGLIGRYAEAWVDIPETFLWHCFLQLSEALAFIHHGYDRRQLCGPPPASEWQAIIHGDIKPENVFLGPPDPADSNGYPSLVLGDFGLATIDEYAVCGTWKWQPPELPMTSKKADVWALGSVVHALAHEGRPPLRSLPQGMNLLEFYRWPAAREPMSLLEIYSTELHNLVIHGALQFDPRARYSSLEVLQCVIVEVELGVASQMELEPLFGPELLAKTYDENGVTENTAVDSEGSFQEMGMTNLCDVESKAYHDPMEYVVCC